MIKDKNDKANNNARCTSYNKIFPFDMHIPALVQAPPSKKSSVGSIQERREYETLAEIDVV